MKKLTYISISLSIAAIITSILALCNTLPRELGMDYMGVIVGILALLTTILLGWNIYTVVDFNNKEKKINDLGGIIKLHKRHEQFISGYASNGIAEIYGILFDNRRLSGKESDYVGHRINAMVSFSECEEIDICNKVADDLIDFLSNGPGQLIDVNTRLQLFDILGGIKNKEKINNYHQLCHLLLKK